MKGIVYFIATFIVLLSTNGKVLCVSIVELSVPDVIQMNSSDVVLDCDYTITEWEQMGLVLKWYVDGVQLVYQWIPPRAPQSLGILKGRIDTSYTAADDPWNKHRAILIQNPTPELSGRYSCAVSTFEEEDTRSADMLIWAPPTKVSLFYWRPSEHLVNISCKAFSVAPAPHFRLYTRDLNGTRYEVEIRGSPKYRQGALWDTMAWGLIVWEDTQPNSEIGCDLTIPGTTHTENRLKVYHP
ncbi:unnamed protein product, partial [Meganyctiphanes norvegica]